MTTRRTIRCIKCLCLFFILSITISLSLIHVNRNQVTIFSDLPWNLVGSEDVYITKKSATSEKSPGNISDTVLSYEHGLIDEHKDPIDLVYLWANGSDPRFILDMKRQKASEEPGKYQRPLRCSSYTESGEYIQVIVVYPGIPQTKVSMETSNIKLLFNVTDNGMEYTVIIPNQNKHGDGIMNILTEINGQMYICMCGYITNENRNQAKKQLDNMYIVKNFNRLSPNTSLEKLELLKRLGIIEVVDGNGIYTLVYVKPDIYNDNINQSLEQQDISNLGLKTAVLAWDTDSIRIEGVKARPNTFQDNDQLRFSLRSVEKYAPWINHIYIITNEQIPCWLNTSNKRISVVFTKDLLPNKKDLPTFSSPVIESHMHRIPGLSESFLFMCDDFYLGKNVQLSDFYTKEEGFKIRWDGMLHFCSPECSHFDVGNGVCNKGCDNDICGFDHGDCRNLTESVMRIGHPVGLHYGSLYHTMAMFNRKKSMFDLSKNYFMPPHRPLLIQKQIAKDMENIFHEEFEQSSSLHFRSQFNIQYTMAYMKFISSARITIPTEQLFDKLEEVRPGMISYKTFEKFADTVLRKYLASKFDAVMNASLQCLGTKYKEISKGLEIPKHLLTKCPAITDITTQVKNTTLKYKHRLLTLADSYFIMLSSFPRAQIDLRNLKRSPRKFNAINDNIDHTKIESVFIKKALHEFFASLFPTPSQFELRT
ncbi:N-acetylglucosamine-1-phosphotransferase subunits alpha/beta-like [Ruditapes philippinarum]|uniref:N-acetylglucosamine-1-phosphotransferase subunits alpha/beta-like n=1 Tax=Ruditapes philippinarum TaxID=129788 RepID=UPI00295BE58B|nr:N-acetylglucosamine-1-phosphotransferase subunits alpha/beta-like [Ruditapes philippinarum]